MTGTDQAIGPDGLTCRDRDIIREILARYPEVRRATLFGSRAMGTFGRGSDIDLALEGPDLTTHTLARIATDLEDSDLPYKADLLLRDRRLDPKLEEHIRRHGRPFGWEETTLGELSAPDDGAIAVGPFGSSMKSDVYVSEGVPVVRGANLDGHPGFRGEFVFVDEDTAARFGRCLIEPGDLVFPHRGAIGAVGLAVNDPPGKWLLSTSMMKFRAHRNRLDPLFAFHFFRSPQGRHELLKNASQVGTPGIGQPLVSLRSCQIPVPPIDEQHAIAGVLGALDDKIEQNRRTARALERLARAIFRAWFVDFEPVKAKAVGATSFPSMPQPVFDALPTGLVDFEIGPVPEGWEVKPLSSVCTLVSGGTPKRSEPSYWGGDVPWYSVKDVSGDGEVWVINTDERITRDGLANSAARIVPKGSTIISARGTVGKLAMAGTPMAFNKSCYGLLPGDECSFCHLYLLMQTAVTELQQRTHESVFDTITRATFDGLMIVSPQSEVVSSFEMVVAPLFDVLLASLQESARLADLRDYLLPRLLNGSVRVKDAYG